MKILLIVNPLKTGGDVQRKIDLVTDWVEKELDITKDRHKADCIITLGGDGTLLYAMGEYGPGYRYFGINLGHLGFLTSSEAECFREDMTEVFMKKQYKEQLSGGLCYSGNGYNGRSVNDVVIKSADSTRVADFDVYVNEKHVSSPKSDGMIISTPMGSTAYNLSVGGSIMNPCASGYILNNIASHSLSMRPVILETFDQVRIVPRQQGVLVVDGNFKGRISGPVVISSDPEKYHILRTLEWDFYDVMKRKLHWGRRGGTDD